MANPGVTTDVEWGKVKVGSEDFGKNLVGTMNEPSQSTVNDYALQTGYTIRESDHNHPINKNTTYPGQIILPVTINPNKK